jgi:hypothetical protein
MAASKEVLHIAISELRRSFDELSKFNSEIKVKILTFIGAGIALTTYLYGGQKEGATAAQILFFPKELYGQFMYVVGALSFFGAMITLVFGAHPAGIWEVPTDIKKLKKLNENNEVKYLEYVKTEYIGSYKNNVKLYEKRVTVLAKAFYPFVFGAMLLIAIKLLGG